MQDIELQHRWSFQYWSFMLELMEWPVEAGSTLRVSSQDRVPCLLLLLLPSQLTLTAEQLPTTSSPMAAPAQHPAPHPSVHACPYVLPLRHQRRLRRWKMVLWATVLSLNQTISIARNWIARKWRFSVLSKIWEGICLKGLLLTFKFTSIIFHYSSALLILACLSCKKRKKIRSVFESVWYTDSKGR